MGSQALHGQTPILSVLHCANVIWINLEVIDVRLIGLTANTAGNFGPKSRPKLGRCRWRCVVNGKLGRRVVMAQEKAKFKIKASHGPLQIRRIEAAIRGAQQSVNGLNNGQGVHGNVAPRPL
jgi:hypothetical protein